MNEKRMRIAAALVLAALGGFCLLAAQTGGGFVFRGPLSRLITPNGDGRNDFAIFCFDNPSDSGVDGKIYSLSGAEVASTSPNRQLSAPPPGPAGNVACPAGIFATSAQFAFWDGKADGAAVRSGIYIYRIKAEGRAYTGTLLVVR